MNSTRLLVRALPEYARSNQEEFLIYDYEIQLATLKAWIYDYLLRETVSVFDPGF